MDIGAAENTVVPVDVLAYFLGLTERRIQQLDVEDVITKIEHGKYNLAESIRAYCEFLRQSERGSVATKEEKAERIKLTRAKRRIAEHNERELAGELLRRDVVRAQDSQLAFILKANLETMPDRIAAIVAAETETETVHNIIAGQVLESLNSVIDAMGKASIDSAEIDITRREALDKMENGEN